MSRTVELRPPICDYCGCFIEDEDQPCPARDEGRVTGSSATSTAMAGMDE